MPVTIEIIDRGYEKMVDSVKSLKGSSVTIGIHKDEGTHPGSGLTMAHLGAIHEFGTDKIPARSWLRATFDNQRNKLGQQMLELEKKIITSAGKVDAEAVLKRMGMVFKADIQVAIANRIPPPLKEATIEAKGGKSVPLVDTGKLRSSIDYVVKAK